MTIAAFKLRFRPATAILSLALTLAACKDGTEPLVPGSVQILAGNQQTAPVAGALPVAPSVKVVTASGKAVPNVRVTFAPAAESGTVVGGVQTTDASGVATVTSWTLGTKAGTSTLTATVEGVAPVSFTATTTAGSPASAAAVASAPLSGLVGTALSVSPAITVKDAYGNAVSGAAVDFLLTTGGSIEASHVQTDANGVASPGRWTLATTSGGQILRATVNSPALLQSPVFFTATAIADVATQMVIARQPSTTAGSGPPLTIQPIVEFRDKYDNVATASTLPVTAALASGSGTLSGTRVVNAQAGRATFTDLAFAGEGQVQLRFTATGYPDMMSASFAISAQGQCAGTALTLDYSVGQSGRFLADSPTLPRCLDFSNARNAGQQYVVLFENLSQMGGFGAGVFPGAPVDDGYLSVAVQAKSVSGAITGLPVAAARVAVPTMPEDAVHGWDLGGKMVYEVEPKAPIGTTSAAMVQRAGELVNANSVSAAVAVGDTLVVQMEGIARLGVPTGMQRAIVRLVTPDIVIAEDLRIVKGDVSFKRGSGELNSPIAQEELELIAADYSQYARVQADRLFENGHNSATTADPGRPIAIHSLMMADNVWGYTYSSTNYFVWDYWVSTQDGVTKDLGQIPQRIADNLFMHEIAHMRHYGLLERSGRTSLRGNRWVVEGFARSIERLPIAMRLLGTPDFSRSENLTLPMNPVLKDSEGRQRYYIDDVPNYLYTTFSMYDGYAASAFVFDYYADQIAKKGGDWMAALREFLINAGSRTDIDAVVNRNLGVDFGTLFSRARLALYLDDFDGALPDWTQYHQYNLRASRPPGSNAGLDPRNAFPRITPGTTFSETRTIGPGGSFGYMIDGSAATSSARIDFTPSLVQNGIMTIIRIK